MGIGAAVIAAALSASAAAQAPEDMGTLAFDEWDAGRVEVAGARLPTVVLYPTDGVGPHPLVGVIHGASRTGARHRVLAETLASRGFVVLLPDIPCGFTGCDHDANADQLIGLLEWAEARSDDGASPIAGLVDADRAALIGHSWGALASHMAAARLPSLDAVVLLDPNDDGTVGLDATSAVMAPTAQLLAQVPGSCNSQWREDEVGAALPAPNLELTVTDSAHCDPEEPGDFLCPVACAAGDASTSVYFRRYTVAWVACLLQGDAAVAPWLGGDALRSDEGDDVVRGTVERGLDALPCLGGGGLDAGPGDLDGGPSGGDAGIQIDAGGGVDAGGGGIDAGVRTDAGAGSESGGGCACRASPGRGARSGAWLGLALLAFVRRLSRGRRAA